MAADKPYSLRDAAAVCGMSVHWLRQRLYERLDLQAIAFRTRVDTGHIRFDQVAFSVWWKAYQEQTAMAKPRPERRPRRQRQQRAKPLDARTSGAADFLAAMRG
jgi:hypothetical protein